MSRKRIERWPAAWAGESEEDARRLFEEAVRGLDTVPVKDADSAAGADPEDADRPPRRIKARAREVTVDEQLDLHGLSGGDAAGRLDRAVPAAARAGTRTLLVITGKGHRSPGGVSVLRPKVEGWIRTRGRRRGVSAYAEAPRALGGRGAWVLFLRDPG